MKALIALSAAAALCSHAAQAAAPQWYFQTGAVSRHFEQTRAPGREWSQTHAGVGLERRDPGDDSAWQVRWAGGLMRDSRDFWGGYYGAAYIRQWRGPLGIDAGLGVGAYAIYRSVSWSGQRKLVPAVLPTASLGLAAGKVGVNIVYVPKIGGGEDGATASLVHAQLLFRFK